MLETIDFSISPLMKISFLGCALFPIILMIVARMGALKSRNALQFLLTALLTAALWLIGILLSIQTTALLSWQELVVCCFIYGTANLVYLEIWALLSRGYTLGLLLTLYKAKAPVNETSLGRLYRGGEGLEWLLKHRLSGLKAAKLVEIKQDEVGLTFPLGVGTAAIYWMLVKFFGLGYTG